MTGSMWVYPWDLVDEGVSTVVSNIMDRGGLSDLSVASVYHSGRFFLPHNPIRKIYFPRSGTLYYRPESSWHDRLDAAGPIWPVLDEHDPWREIGEAVHERGGTLTSWCLGMHNSGLGERRPDLCVRNAVGDVLTTDLCAANPHVVEVIVEQTGNAATATAADRMLLESFEYMGLRHGFHHEVFGVPVAPDMAMLLAMCFCPSCTERGQAADVDVPALQAWVANEIFNHFRAPLAEGDDAFDWDEYKSRCGGQIGAYLEVRAQSVTALIEAVTQRVRDVSSARIGLVDFGPLYNTGPDGARWESGLDLDQIAPYVDELHPTCYLADPGANAASIRAYADFAPTGMPIHGAIRAILPQIGSEEQLAESVAAFTGIADGLSFYNYGFMALETLDWIKNAVADFTARERN